MKKAVTFRLDRDLLDEARRLAKAENRSLTNFIETLLKMRADQDHLAPAERSWAPADGGDQHAR